jgi:hypothetical protein
MKFDIDWDTVEAIGIEFVKESYVGLLETFSGYDPENADHKEDFYNDEWRLECFETVLKYILPKGESHAFIAGQRQKHLSQIDLFISSIKEVWEDMTAGELSENERTYIKTSAVIFLLFLYVWVTI